MNESLGAHIQNLGIDGEKQREDGRSLYTRARITQGLGKACSLGLLSVPWGSEANPALPWLPGAWKTLGPKASLVTWLFLPLPSSLSRF